MTVIHPHEKLVTGDPRSRPEVSIACTPSIELLARRTNDTLYTPRHHLQSFLHVVAKNSIPALRSQWDSNPLEPGNRAGVLSEHMCSLRDVEGKISVPPCERVVLRSVNLAD